MTRSYQVGGSSTRDAAYSHIASAGTKTAPLRRRHNHTPVRTHTRTPPAVGPVGASDPQHAVRIHIHTLARILVVVVGHVHTRRQGDPHARHVQPDASAGERTARPAAEAQGLVLETIPQRWDNLTRASASVSASVMDLDWEWDWGCDYDCDCGRDRAHVEYAPEVPGAPNVSVALEEDGVGETPTATNGQTRVHDRDRVRVRVCAFENWIATSIVTSTLVVPAPACNRNRTRRRARAQARA